MEFLVELGNPSEPPHATPVDCSSMMMIHSLLSKVEKQGYIRAVELIPVTSQQAAP